MSDVIPDSARADVETLRKVPLRVSLHLKTKKISQQIQPWRENIGWFYCHDLINTSSNYKWIF